MGRKKGGKNKIKKHNNKQHQNQHQHQEVNINIGRNRKPRRKKHNDHNDHHNNSPNVIFQPLVIPSYESNLGEYNREPTNKPFIGGDLQGFNYGNFIPRFGGGGPSRGATTTIRERVGSEAGYPNEIIGDILGRHEHQGHYHHTDNIQQPHPTANQGGVLNRVGNDLYNIGAGALASAATGAAVGLVTGGPVGAVAGGLAGAEAGFIGTTGAVVGNELGNAIGGNTGAEIGNAVGAVVGAVASTKRLQNRGIEFNSGKLKESYTKAKQNINNAINNIKSRIRGTRLGGERTGVSRLPRDIETGPRTPSRLYDLEAEIRPHTRIPNQEWTISSPSAISSNNLRQRTPSRTPQRSGAASAFLTSGQSTPIRDFLESTTVRRLHSARESGSHPFHRQTMLSEASTNPSYSSEFAFQLGGQLTKEQLATINRLKREHRNLQNILLDSSMVDQEHLSNAANRQMQIMEELQNLGAKYNPRMKKQQ